MTDTYEYPGGELALFAGALNWKAYFARRLAPHLRGDVLEVGAGLGKTTEALWNTNCSTWTCLEPDPSLAAGLTRAAASLTSRGATLRALTGTLADVDAGARFDAILYIDVLEHIEDDRGELLRASRHLAPGGRLIVLSPAHPFLYTPFDAAIGHHRRYTRSSLAALRPEGLSELEVVYLDSAGLLASLANRLLLRQSMPTERQIQVWDRLLVPVSSRLDCVLAHRVGKTVVAIWEQR